MRTVNIEEENLLHIFQSTRRISVTFLGKMRFMILVKGHKKAALRSLSRNLQKISTTLTGLKYVCQWVNQKQSFPLQKKLPLKGFFFF